MTDLFAPLAMKISGGIIAALVLALGFTIWRADNLSGRLEDKRDELAQSEVLHAVTRASLNALEAELGKMVDEGVLRADRLARATAEQERASADMRRMADAVLAADTSDPCVTPDVILNAGGI